MEITYFELIGSLRKYIQDKTGVKCVWKYYGYKRPTEKPFVEIEYVNSNIIELTKTKDFISEDVFLNIGVHGETLTQMSDAHRLVKPILMYDTIPIINNKNETLGEFSIEHINGISNIMYGVESENESETNRLYIDVSIPIAHVKKFV